MKDNAMTTMTTFSVSFPKALLRRLDRVAKREKRSRSELLRVAVLMYIERKRHMSRSLQDGLAQRPLKALRGFLKGMRVGQIREERDRL